jgi:hypothetical protein
MGVTLRGVANRRSTRPLLQAAKLGMLLGAVASSTPGVSVV